uniref:Uncharacterized protein n=1 Tax=Cryptomonas curvata TaxID=233186 RepID=A0A7S0NC39_9CRYP
MTGVIEVNTLLGNTAWIESVNDEDLNTICCGKFKEEPLQSICKLDSKIKNSKEISEWRNAWDVCLNSPPSTPSKEEPDRTETVSRSLNRDVWTSLSTPEAITMEAVCGFWDYSRPALVANGLLTFDDGWTATS